MRCTNQKDTTEEWDKIPIFGNGVYRSKRYCRRIRWNFHLGQLSVQITMIMYLNKAKFQFGEILSTLLQYLCALWTWSSQMRIFPILEITVTFPEKKKKKTHCPALPYQSRVNFRHSFTRTSLYCCGVFNMHMFAAPGTSQFCLIQRTWQWIPLPWELGKGRKHYCINWDSNPQPLSRPESRVLFLTTPPCAASVVIFSVLIEYVYVQQRCNKHCV